MHHTLRMPPQDENTPGPGRFDPYEHGDTHWEIVEARIGRCETEYVALEETVKMLRDMWSQLDATADRLKVSCRELPPRIDEQLATVMSTLEDIERNLEWQRNWFEFCDSYEFDEYCRSGRRYNMKWPAA